MRIFVTVGTGKFDELVRAIDLLAPKLSNKMTIQIGKGAYVPKNCRSFRFSPNLDKYYKSSDLIISHGGAGTIYELLRQGKKIIAVANLNRTDTHQYEILKALSSDNYLIWCKDVSLLEESIIKAKKFRFREYTPPKCSIAKKISEFVLDFD